VSISRWNNRHKSRADSSAQDEVLDWKIDDDTIVDKLSVLDDNEDVKDAGRSTNVSFGSIDSFVDVQAETHFIGTPRTMAETIGKTVYYHQLVTGIIKEYTEDDRVAILTASGLTEYKSISDVFTSSQADESLQDCAQEIHWHQYSKQKLEEEKPEEEEVETGFEEASASAFASAENSSSALSTKGASAFASAPEPVRQDFLAQAFESEKMVTEVDAQTPDAPWSVWQGDQRIIAHGLTTTTAEEWNQRSIEMFGSVVVPSEPVNKKGGKGKGGGANAAESQRHSLRAAVVAKGGSEAEDAESEAGCCDVAW